MIIIFLIGKEHNLYYINVYRGSYKHALKIMRPDEVYQAALAAGSGGIRWNSTSQWIEIMDDNKNWVNWKRFDPNKFYVFKSGQIDETGGVWYTFENSNTSYSSVVYNSDLISIYSKTNGNNSVDICFNRKFDFAPYDVLTVTYHTATLSAYAGNIMRTLYLSTYHGNQGGCTPGAANVITFSVMNPSTTTVTVSLDITSIDRDGYIYIRYGNSNGNTFTLTELYLSNY